MKTKLMVLLVGLCTGSSLAFLLTCYHRCSGLASPSVSVETINNKKALVISALEHPPWAHSNIYGVAFDYDSMTVDVTEYYMILHPFSPQVLGRLPIVIQGGLIPGNYALRFWDGELQQYTVVGRVITDDKGNIEWHPTPESPRSVSQNQSPAASDPESPVGGHRVPTAA